VSDTILVKFKVVQDGDSFKIIGQEAEKASDSVDKVAKSAKNADRNLKGAANMTSNGTKQFSKMSQGITGGLVPAYATLAANVFAISAAFNFFKRAADLKILEEGQSSYAANTGIALQSITANLREASGGMLGFKEAAEAAAMGVAKGFSPDQLNALAEGAKKAASALGRNFEDAFDRLIRGASKAEPELLDELGITLRLETATKRYADQVGKSAKDLNTFEKSQAVLLETQRQLDAQFGQMEGKTNPFVELSKTFDDIVKAGTNFILPFFEGLAAIINRSAVAAIAVFGALGLSIFKAMIPMDSMKEKINNFKEKSKSSLQAAEADLESYKQKLEETRAAIESASAKSVQDSAKGKSFQGTDSKLIQKAQKGQLTDPKEVGRLKAILKKAEKEYRRTGKIKSGIFKNSNAKDRASLLASLNAMNKDHKTFIQKRKMQLKGMELFTKKHYAKVRALGTTALLGIGKAGARAGRMIGKAMAMAGFIGMIMIVFEMVKSLGTKIGTLMKSITKGFDFVANGIGGMLNFVLGGFGKMIDSIGNGLKAFINLYIKAYNMIPGVDDLKEFEANSTSAQDAMSNLIGTANSSSEDSFVNRMAMNLQNFTLNSIEAKEAANNLKDAIKTLGKDLTNAVSGNERFASGTMKSLEKSLKAGKISFEEYFEGITNARAKMQQNQATTISTMGTGALMEELKDMKDGARKTELQDLLNSFIPKLEKTNTQFADAVKSGNIDLVLELEKTARTATAGMASLQNSILDLSSAMGSGDLLKAEIALDALKDTSQLTSTQFEKLFGKDTESAEAALAKYETAFQKAGMSTEEFRLTLKKLRADTQAFAAAKTIEGMVGGTAGEMLKASNAVRELILQQRTLNLEKITASESRKKEIDAEIKLLELKTAQAQHKASFAGTGDLGEGMGNSMAIAESLKYISEDAGAAEKLSIITASMNEFGDSFKKLGPEGEYTAAVIAGIAAISMAADNLSLSFQGVFDSMEKAMGAEAFEKLDSFGAKWDEMSFENKAQTVAAVAQAAASAIGQMASMMAAKSKKAIAGVDKQIEREKVLDGQSQASVEKIKALEAKKEKMKRKAFETDKKLKLAQAVMSTAAGIATALTLPPPLNFIMAGLVGAMGAMQINMISGMTYDSGAKQPAAPTKISAGSRQNNVDLSKGNNAGGELAYMRGAKGQGTGASDFTPAFSGYKHRAAGGYVVGEQGPEIFVPQVPGDIIPAGQDMGGTSNVNFSINAVDATGVQELLIEQRGNIIGMIREAANENGQFFLEDVDNDMYGA